MKQRITSHEANEASKIRRDDNIITTKNPAISNEEFRIFKVLNSKDMTKINELAKVPAFFYSALFFHPNYEVWKPIIGYEGLYEISSYGRVRSVDRVDINSLGRSRRLKGQAIKLMVCKSTGYSHFSLCKNNIKLRANVHRLVAIHFIPNPKNLPQVNHIDAIRYNALMVNLEWVTIYESW